MPTHGGHYVGYYKPDQMGNLNKDSAHPNPWHPPTEYERFWGGMGIGCHGLYHNPKDPIGPIPKGQNFLEDDPFLDNCRWAATKGLYLGTALALHDITNVHGIVSNRARFARYCFIVPPYVAMGVSFVCAQQLLGNVSKEKNAWWTYPASVVAPATVWGVFKNSLEKGIRFAVFGSLAAAYWKYNKDSGYMFDPLKGFTSFEFSQSGPKDLDHEEGIYRHEGINVDGWKGWPFRIDSVKTWWTPTDEPKWKQHVSTEEANKGPPTNF